MLPLLGLVLGKQPEAVFHLLGTMRHIPDIGSYKETGL